MVYFSVVFVQIIGVGGWVSRNPNIVWILKSVGKNRHSLIVGYLTPVSSLIQQASKL